MIAVLSAGLFLVVTASYVSELDLAARYHWDPNGDTFVNTTRNLLFAAAASLVGFAGGYWAFSQISKNGKQSQKSLN